MCALDPSTREVRVRLSDGTTLLGSLHPAWEVQQALSLQGKLWDLSKAYRQLARSPAHASLSVVATWNSTRRCVEFYEQ
eukprot:2867635-Heterocapsa_arctica.AAC.1